MFQRDTDLLQEFAYFLPDPVGDAQARFIGVLGQPMDESLQPLKSRMKVKENRPKKPVIEKERSASKYSRRKIRDRVIEEHNQGDHYAHGIMGLGNPRDRMPAMERSFFEKVSFLGGLFFCILVQ